MTKINYFRTEKLEIISLKDKPQTYGDHNHVSVFTIGFILNGDLKLKCDGKITIYSAPSFFILTPYQVHSLLLPKKYEMLSICINQELIETCSANELFHTLSKLIAQFSVNLNDSLLLHAVNTLFECNRPTNIENTITSSALIFCHNPEDSINLQTLAETANYSLYHYIKLFKQQIGLTPHKFQIQNRIRKAQRLIENGGNITDIAMDLGFYDQSHFNKYFKNIMGITPSEYQKAFKRL